MDLGDLRVAQDSRQEAYSLYVECLNIRLKITNADKERSYRSFRDLAVVEARIAGLTGDADQWTSVVGIWTELDQRKLLTASDQAKFAKAKASLAQAQSRPETKPETKP